MNVNNNKNNKNNLSNYLDENSKNIKLLNISTTDQEKFINSIMLNIKKKRLENISKPSPLIHIFVISVVLYIIYKLLFFWTNRKIIIQYLYQAKTIYQEEQAKTIYQEEQAKTKSLNHKSQ